MVTWDIGFELSKTRLWFMFNILALLDALKHCSTRLYTVKFLNWERFYYIKQREEDDIIDWITTTENVICIGQAVATSQHLFDS